MGRERDEEYKYNHLVDFVVEDIEGFNDFEIASALKEYFLNYGNGYCIMSFIDFDGTWFANVSGSVFEKGFQGASEPEAVYKACEWIIEHEASLEKEETTETPKNLKWLWMMKWCESNRLAPADEVSWRKAEEAFNNREIVENVDV